MNAFTRASRITVLTWTIRGGTGSLHEIDRIQSPAQRRRRRGRQPGAGRRRWRGV